MMLKRWKIVLFSSVFVLLILTFLISPQLELPGATGPYQVGRTLMRWVDTSRPEVLTEDPNDDREVIAWVWYPAEPGTGAKTGYFPNLAALSDAMAQSGEVAPWEVLGLRFIRSDILLDGLPLKRQGPFPVVILSPGNGTNVEFYSSLASEIASHGYIVFGINHPYDVAAVELSNGEVAAYNKAQWSLGAAAHQDYVRERIKVRTQDVLFAVDQLDRMNATGSFAGTMDLPMIAVAGHSLGGITASEACKADARFRACLNFDGLQMGGPFSTKENAIPPEQPFLFLTKEAQLHPRIVERFESMPQSYWVVVHHASHASFTDGPLLQPSLLPGPTPAGKVMDFIQEYTLAFLDQTLKGQTSELLSASFEGKDVSVKAFPSN